VPAVPVLVTTSWEDGHQLDEKLTQEFDAHGLAAMFCIAPRPAEIPPTQRLNRAALGGIVTRFEIGSHTLTDPHLTRLREWRGYFAGHDGVTLLTNGELAGRLPGQRTGGAAGCAAGRGAER
jgi:hypothetical protein